MKQVIWNALVKSFDSFFRFLVCPQVVSESKAISEQLNTILIQVKMDIGLALRPGSKLSLLFEQLQYIFLLIKYVRQVFKLNKYLVKTKVHQNQITLSEIFHPIVLEPSTHFLHKKIAWGGFKITAQQRSHATFLRLRFCLLIL